MQPHPISIEPVVPRKYRHPWRYANRFELLCDGPAFFPRMLAAIAEARRYVLLEMYLIESGSVLNRFAEALGAAAARGVAVKLLLDDFGARGLSHYDRQRLGEYGVEIAYFNPLRYGKWLANVARNHRKLLLVDGRIAFVGGAGIADEFDPPEQPERRWRDNMLQIEGVVLQDWQALFLETWRQCRAAPLWLPLPPPETASNYLQAGRLTQSNALVHQEIKRALLRNIRASRARIWLCTAYFVPSWQVRRALRRAAARGVDVRLLLPGPYTDHPGVRHAGRRFYARLLRAGVRIFEYQPRVLHAKLALCDDWLSIGSSNFDRWTFTWNLEANQEVADGRCAAQVAAALAQDFAASVEYHYETWQQRPRRARLWEWLYGRIDAWLHRLGASRKG